MAVWIWVFKSRLDGEWSLEASVAELVDAHPHPLQEAAGNERPWAWVWLVQRCGSPGGSTCPISGLRGPVTTVVPIPERGPGPLLCWEPLLPVRWAAAVASRAHGLQHLPQEQTSEALSFQPRALIPESAGRGPGLCASQVPQLILMGRHTRETTERRAGAGSEQTEPSWSGTFPERTAPHIQNAGRGSHC